MEEATPGMHIYVDESGSFPETRAANSWSLVCAYVSPEKDSVDARRAVKKIRESVAGTPEEVKLRDVGEQAYFEFLGRLGRMRGIAFATATDMSMSSAADLAAHQKGQAAKIVQHIDKMKHQAGRDGLKAMADELLGLAPNLYAQLALQIALFGDALAGAPLYFVQRTPRELGHFGWRVDRKDISITRYETAFRHLVTPALQTMSIEEPFIQLEGADYSHMAKYQFADGMAPAYLTDVYGIPARPAFDLGKIMRDDFQFVDSKEHPGIQIADLLASGFRRLLKGGFQNNDEAARLLGAILLQSPRESLPIRLVSLGAPATGDAALERTMRILSAQARPMLLP